MMFELAMFFSFVTVLLLGLLCLIIGLGLFGAFKPLSRLDEAMLSIAQGILCSIVVTAFSSVTCYSWYLLEAVANVK